MNWILEVRNHTDMRQWYQEFFQNIADNTDAYRLLIKAKVPTGFVFQYDKESLLKALQIDNSNIARYRAIAIANTLADVSFDWFQSGMKETPEEMAEIIYQIFHEKETSK